MSEMKGILEEKSFRFAIRIVNLYKYLSENKKEYVMAKQVLRSGTSIAANIAEAQFAQSKPDFGTKMQISLKEANETRFWLRLLSETSYIDSTASDSLISDCEEIINMLISSCKTINPRKV